jgi:hypothetical protein
MPPHLEQDSVHLKCEAQAGNLGSAKVSVDWTTANPYTRATQLSSDSCAWHVLPYPLTSCESGCYINTATPWKETCMNRLPVGCRLGGAAHELEELRGADDRVWDRRVKKLAFGLRCKAYRPPRNSSFGFVFAENGAVCVSSTLPSTWPRCEATQTEANTNDL